MRKILVLLAVLALAPLRAHAAMTILTTQPVDRGPASIAIDPVTQQAFVGNVTDNSVSVFSGVVRVATISQPGLNPTGVAVDGAGARVLVTSYDAERVNVFSTADRRKVGSIVVSGRPWGIAVDSTNGNAFITKFAADKLAVIRRDNSTASDIALPGCAGPIGAAYSEAAKRVVVTCIYSGTVHFIDAVALQHAGSYTVGLGAYTHGVAAVPGSTMVFVTNEGNAGPTGGTVMKIDAATGVVAAVSHTGGAPVGVSVSQAGTPYVTLSLTHKLAALDPATGAIVETIDLPRDGSTPQLPNNPQAVAVHPSGRFAIVGNFHAESVSFVSTLPYL